MTVASVNTGPVAMPIDLKTMDLETALMMVQSQRANLLEGQLSAQINAVKQRNDQISKLNDALSALNKISAAFSGDAKADTKIGKDQYNKLNAETNQAMEAAGISPGLSDKVDNSAKIAELQKGGREGLGFPSFFPEELIAPIRQAKIAELQASHNPTGGLSADTTKGKVDAAINQIKSLIDGANNSNQMDMLRLQSLTNKRNEAFDLMTNFIKKMQDSRSSIIGNMR